MKIVVIACAVLIFAFIAFGPIPAKAVSMSIPTVGNGAATNASPAPGTFIDNFYQFALFLSGIIAFGAIVFGGIKYMTAAGNPSAQSEGKEWIYSALLGMALLAGAYLILDTVNPQLVNLSLPVLQSTNIAGTNAQSCGVCGGTCNGTCASGQSCDATGAGYICHGGVACSGSCGGNCSGTCPAGQTCNSTGIGYVCNGGSACNGSCGGSCSGSCPSGQSCNSTGAGYVCSGVAACNGSCGGSCSGSCPNNKTCHQSGYGYVCL